MKLLLASLLVLVLMAGCNSSPPPIASHEPSVMARLHVDASRITELVGDRTVDISTNGRFVTKFANGRIAANEIQGTEDDPGMCSVSIRVGEQACHLASLDHHRQVSMRIRHRTGVALTPDDCRDLARIVDTWPELSGGPLYALVYTDVEADGHACVYAVNNPY